MEHSLSTKDRIVLAVVWVVFFSKFYDSTKNTREDNVLCLKGHFSVFRSSFQQFFPTLLSKFQRFAAMECTASQVSCRANSAPDTLIREHPHWVNKRLFIIVGRFAFFFRRIPKMYSLYGRNFHSETRLFDSFSMQNGMSTGNV